MINIEEITAASWRKAYGLPLSCSEPYHRERGKAIAFASGVAQRVIEQAIKEIGAVSVMAQDAAIVKEKITARLRVVASGIPH